MDIDEPPAEEPVLIPPTEASASPTKPVTPNPLKVIWKTPLLLGYHSVMVFLKVESITKKLHW